LDLLRHKVIPTPFTSGHDYKQNRCIQLKHHTIFSTNLQVFFIGYYESKFTKKKFHFLSYSKNPEEKKTLSISQLIVEQSIEEETQNRLKNLD
jgi:hypothetical protein